MVHTIAVVPIFTWSWLRQLVSRYLREELVDLSPWCCVRENIGLQAYWTQAGLKLLRVKTPALSATNLTVEVGWVKLSGTRIQRTQLRTISSVVADGTSVKQNVFDNTVEAWVLDQKYELLGQWIGLEGLAPRALGIKSWGG